MVTYRLGVTLKVADSTVYTIIGSEKGPMTIPSAWQMKTFGVNYGGVSSDISKIFNDALYDSWLTVGITGGDSGNALGNAGLANTMKAWTPSAGGFGKGFTNKDCGIFWMNPVKTTAKGKGKIVLAQLTLKKGTSVSASMGVSGKLKNGETWRENSVVFKK